MGQNRNIFLFEGRSFSPIDSIREVREDADSWRLSHIVNRDVENDERKNGIEIIPSWSFSPTKWCKCNLGVSLAKNKGIGGCAWVLRDDNGNVLLHSQRSVGNITSKQDLNLSSFLWAAESMHSHKIDKVLFALEDLDLVGAINRPKAWPNFAYQRSEMNSLLEKIQE